LFATQERLEADLQLTERLLAVNFTNTVLFCEHARTRLLRNGGGTLCVFSSVAGDRGRKPIVLYGAAKAGLSAYLEGLDHKFRSSGLVVVCVKPGFVRTSMTEGLPQPPFAGDPDTVARRVVRAIDRGTPVVYAPAVWQLVLLIIRYIPRAIMRRLQF
jgi:decaprenylphospho-beta-D-erythro-pentofuranosid-2-ulose 2-reductase